MAECHPVGFQWVMEAKARGAKVIHVDPRFTRTSALADLHVPIRAGADIAFLGGIVNYVLQHEKYFRDYVVTYTNAPVILTEDYADTEDLDGVFSGLDRDIEARVLVTERMATLTIAGPRLHQVGLPYHWGTSGYSTGDSANDLASLSLDPNVHIQEVKAFACDIRRGRRPRGRALPELVKEYQRRAGITADTGMEM